MAAFTHRLPARSQLQPAQDRTCLSGHLKPLPQLVARRQPCVVAQADKNSSWYEHSNRSSTPSQPTRSSTSAGEKRQRSKHYFESTPKHRKNTPDQQDAYQQPRQQQRQQKRQQVDEYEDDLEDAGPGWWEVRREDGKATHNRDAAQTDLLPWQEEMLLIAAAGSKKKMQVQQLAGDLGLDRSEVLSWVAAFRAKPKQEQDKLLKPLQGKIQQQQLVAQQQQQEQQQQQQRRQAADISWGAVQTSDSGSGGSSGPLPFSSRNPDTGFVPFAERRASGQTKSKRLSGEVLRTLEHLYDRGPWPNKDAISGLYDLHRLPREVALEWFRARREMDGLPNNPRLAKKAGLRPADAVAQQITPPQQQQQQQQQGSNKPPPAAAAAPAVSRLTARELAALRSSLPSPNKFKGAKLSQELGIKTVEGPGSTPQQVEISGVVFVARDGAAAWRKVWRKRRGSNGFPLQRLDFKLWCRSRGI